MYGKFFFFKDIPAETMDDAATKAKTGAERSLKIVSVAPAPAVRPDVRESNIRQMDGASIFEIVFGKFKG